MKKTILVLMMFTLILSRFSSESVENETNERVNLVVLTTGGTIAGKGTSETGSAYIAGKVSGNDLIEAVPELGHIAQITVEEISNVPSQDMSIDIWLKLAKRINELLNQDHCDGIVITHGTDTMEETAYFLNLTVHSNKPVVLTGSMRPSTSISADGDINLYNAVAVAASKASFGRGVLIVMNDAIYAARDATKFNTTNVDTFKNLNGGPVGYAHYGCISFYSSTEKAHTVDSVFDTSDLLQLPRIEIIYGYADSGSLFVNAAIEAGVDGLIFAGVGDGNGTIETLEALTSAAKKDITVVISSRTGSGMVYRNSEYDFDTYRFISANNLNAQKARILLMLSLTKTKDSHTIQQYFDHY